MNKVKVLSLVLFYILLLTSCTTSQIDSNNLSEKIRIIDVESWLNMMPGGPGSFHIIGKYEIPDSLEFEVELTKIKVLSDSIDIYIITKENYIVEKQIDNNLKIIEYAFHTKPGIGLNERIQLINQMDVKLFFDFEGREIVKELNSIELTRAY